MLSTTPHGALPEAWIGVALLVLIAAVGLAISGGVAVTGADGVDLAGWALAATRGWVTLSRAASSANPMLSNNSRWANRYNRCDTTALACLQHQRVDMQRFAVKAKYD